QLIRCLLPAHCLLSVAISANLFTTIFAPRFCAFGMTLPVRFGFPSTLAVFAEVRPAVRWRAGSHGTHRQIHASDCGPCPAGNSYPQGERAVAEWMTFSV